MLTALAMVASVLVAVPAVAADPKADFTADFDACADSPSSGFSDIPMGHANAGDIDCIAYYGITKGTSATTYSPLMSVSREHMALFLTRLAGLVGIEVASNPSDPGFTDTGDLSAESQTAIAQLYDLGITKGTSMTTYSPADNVKRGHMALFIQRLMNKMTPIGGSKSAWGHTPSDVAANTDTKKPAMSPFTDLGSSTKNEYDAITQLWELGVASGISDTSYAPSSDITRAAMAGFMAGLLDHSNARPAGVTIQATPGSKFGGIVADDKAAVVISVRNESFAPVVDQALDHFNSDAPNGGLVRGECSTEAGVVTGNCTWNESDDFTGKDGNLVLSNETVDRGKTKVYYAWIGAKDGDKFDAAKVDYDSASMTAQKDEKAMKTSSTISKNATSNQVDLDTVDSVTITVQLVDTANTADDGPADGAKAVARSGQKIRVGVKQQSNADGGTSPDAADDVTFNSTMVATLTTDSDGKVVYTVDGPTDDNDNGDVQIGDKLSDDSTAAAGDVANLEDRVDTITFTYLNADNDGTLGTSGAATVTFTIDWSEENSVTAMAKAVADPYVIPAGGKAKVMATVTFYDQYGNGFRQGSGQKVGIQFGAESGSPVANVNGNGIARRGITMDATAGTPIAVAYNADPTETPNDVDIPDAVTLTGGTIQVVVEANEDSTGSANVHRLFADSDKFTAEDPDAAANAKTLYSYDSDDTFIRTGDTVTMAKFEELLANPSDDTAANPAVVNVVRYNPDGESIFVVTTPSS